MGRTRHFESGLTPRQKEVLRLIVKGHTNGEIAEKLGVSLAGAKWHVSELLSRFGVNSREDLAELMERERRGPVERTRGWMAGLVGLMSVKVGGGAAVAAGIGVAAIVGAGTFAWVISNDTPVESHVPPDVSELLPDDPGDSVFDPEEAYAIAAREADRQFESFAKSGRPDLDFALAEARWLPSSTGFWFRGFDWKWESANREVHDLWSFRWELVDGSLMGEDAHVTVIVSDGYSIPLGSVGTHEDRRTGVEMTFGSGIAPPPTPTPPPPPNINWVVFSGNQLRTAVIMNHPWCSGSGGISAVGPAQVTAACPPVLPEHEPIRPYLDTQGTPDGSTMRTMHVAYRQPIVRIAVVLDTGQEVEILNPDSSRHAQTLTGAVIIPHGTVPTELIGYDADGNEVGRREYPPRPLRP